MRRSVDLNCLIQEDLELAGLVLRDADRFGEGNIGPGMASRGQFDCTSEVRTGARLRICSGIGAVYLVADEKSLQRTVIEIRVERRRTPDQRVRAGQRFRR